MTMVEKMARAIAAHMEAGFPDRVRTSWDSYSPSVKAAMASRAVAALKAMREPTEAMKVGSIGVNLSPSEAGDIFSSMIDAAIAEHAATAIGNRRD